MFGGIGLPERQWKGAIKSYESLWLKSGGQSNFANIELLRPPVQGGMTTRTPTRRGTATVLEQVCRSKKEPAEAGFLASRFKKEHCVGDMGIRVRRDFRNVVREKKFKRG